MKQQQSKRGLSDLDRQMIDLARGGECEVRVRHGDGHTTAALLLWWRPNGRARVRFRSGSEVTLQHSRLVLAPELELLRPEVAR